MAVRSEWNSEFEELLDAVSYEISNARASGLDKPEQTRAALKKMRSKVAEAETLAVAVVNERNKSDD
jgi:hypothetical protein